MAHWSRARLAEWNEVKVAIRQFGYLQMVSRSPFIGFNLGRELTYNMHMSHICSSSNVSAAI